MDFLSIDLPAIFVAVLAATSCSLLGNFLVLRRQALIGDAISHAVLPGIVIGFLLAGTLSTLPLMLGAIGAAILAAGLIEALRQIGRIEAGAAMGVVFTTMFAAGIVLLEQAGASNVHIDAEHALYGSLESIIWMDLTVWMDLFTLDAYAGMPRHLVTLIGVTFSIVALVFLFFKELKVATFDPDLAVSIGLPMQKISTGFIVLVAVAAVASFEAVGSILVIAMFICPAATARMLTDKLSRQLWISAGVATLAGVGGYLFAAFGPQLWGSSNSLNAAGAIAVVAGLLQVMAMVAGPRYGALTRTIKKRKQRPASIY
ncbi:MAG: zinc ABC transporter permease [Pelagibacteraceae bacterium]|nr:zinc ABC transporter permease [Pelagibacteraceae bacterium]